MLLDQETQTLEEMQVEFHHYEEEYEAKLTSFNEASSQSQAILEHLAFKFDQARECLAEFGGYEPVDHPGVARFAESLGDIRDSLKRLSNQNSIGGPPLA